VGRVCDCHGWHALLHDGEARLLRVDDGGYRFGDVVIHRSVQKGRHIVTVSHRVALQRVRYIGCRQRRLKLKVE
jgi:hypothetical protein